MFTLDKRGRAMKKYTYNPTKPHHFLIAGTFGAAAIYGYMLLICYLSYIMGGIL